MLRSRRAPASPIRPKLPLALARVILGAGATALAGCSVTGLAVDGLASALAKSGDAFASDDDPELVRDMNRALAIMKSQGTLNYIINRWIPVQVQVR